MWRINGTEAPNTDVIGERCMVEKNWERYERDYIYVGLTRMGANGDWVLVLMAVSIWYAIGYVYII